ncbi:SCO2322 family protein [Streptomyces sp. SBT349]|uniref:SCO2322 family protein n=1 Tax=Streptomyces sp. SBT349 TaxID=1580539 RepID=UPI00069FA0AF|nr:SCO2322 family protein [Streptomyces sp. SBT349]
MRPRPRARWGPAALAAACLVLTGGAVAHADGNGNGNDGGGGGGGEPGGYRYWSFWTWDEGEGRWSYATQGPGLLRPGDGDVLGFRFTASARSGDAEGPRGPADFAAVCGGEGTAGGDGGNRVALVIDFGTADDAPGGATPPERRAECAALPEGATAAEALAATAEPLRYNADALLCAIAGYPEAGCAESLAGGGPADEDGSAGDGSGGSDGGATLAWAAGAGAVALLGGAAWARARARRRQA